MPPSSASPAIRPSQPQSPSSAAWSVAREHLRVVLAGAQHLLERRAALDGGAQLGGAGGVDAREPVEAVRGVRREARPADRRDDPVAQERGAGQRVRSAAGVAEDREPVEPEGVGDGLDVAGRGGDVATGVRGRAAVAGAVVGHPADAALGARGQQRLRRGADVGGAVVPDDGQDGVVDGDVVRAQRPAVGCRDLDHRLSFNSSISSRLIWLARAKSSFASSICSSVRVSR